MKKTVIIILGLFCFLTLFSNYANADVLKIDFENPSYYIPSDRDEYSIDGQDGWSSKCSITDSLQCDHFLSNNKSIFPSFGLQSLRISNSINWSGIEIPIENQTYSKSLINESGEISATSNNYSGGRRKQYFEAEWEFGLVSPSSEENSGLFAQISPDRGDGSRYSYVRINHIDNGLNITFKEYKKELVTDSINPDLGFEDTLIAQNLSKSIPHKIRLKMNFLDGPSNDIVLVYVDDVLVKEGITWEDYYRLECWSYNEDGSCEEHNTEIGARTVDSLLFKTYGENGSWSPQTKGFYIDNVVLKSHKNIDAAYDVETPDQCKDGGWEELNEEGGIDGQFFKNQGDCESFFQPVKK